MADGKVVKTWDLEELLVIEQSHVYENRLDHPPHGWGNAVLNGIAYIPSRDSFLLSGKEWTNIFEVKLDYLNYMSN